MIANGAAQSHGLDFVEFVNSDGTLVSFDAHIPRVVGYKTELGASTRIGLDGGVSEKREECGRGGRFVTRGAPRRPLVTKRSTSSRAAARPEFPGFAGASGRHAGAAIQKS